MEIADYGLTSLYFTRKDFIKWWMAPRLYRHDIYYQTLIEA